MPEEGVLGTVWSRPYFEHAHRPRVGQIRLLKLRLPKFIGGDFDSPLQSEREEGVAGTGSEIKLTVKRMCADVLGLSG